MDSKTQLFGQPLFKICPDELSLPKPVTVSRLLTTSIMLQSCNTLASRPSQMEVMQM